MPIRQSMFETEHALLPRMVERAYTPTPGEKDREGNHGNLAIESLGGDWSWKPWRDKKLGDSMKTFLGVPAGAAEIYGPRVKS